ncbi:MAG: DEAD/DEAH box helicase, partial [Elusimicrobiota bacterium]
APTRLLIHSQFENIVGILDEHEIRYTILESGASFATLVKHLFENDFIISSPDIIFYIILRKKRAQHLNFLYSEFLKCLHSVVFDELHLFDTYTLYNINNLIKIWKNIKNNVRIYILSATIELNDIIDQSQYLIIDGVSKTKKVHSSALELNYFDVDTVIKFLEHSDYIEDTIYVCNSVDRALRLHKHFKDSAILVGKTWYDEEIGLSRDDQIKANLNKCRNGELTFTTSVFRQGVDISLKNLITEEPITSQDAIQTFGRCGRHEASNFIMLTNNSQVINTLNTDKEVSREEFERILTTFFKPKNHEKLKKMMKAMWYKLYDNTKLKNHVKFLLTNEMREAYYEFENFLPDLSFREPAPAIQYDDLTISLFDILQFKDAYKYLHPSDNSFVVGVLKDGGRLTRREYKRAKKEDLPKFTLIDSKRYEETEYYNLVLKLRDIFFKVNAKVGPVNKYLYTYIDSKKLVPTQKSFKPVVFFE